MSVGQFAIKSGPTFASASRFRITVRGKGTHAANSHDGIDPAPIACQMVQGFQSIITRNKRPLDTAVISVTTIHAGEATNVIPDTCEIQGTVRTFTLEVLDMIEHRMRTVSECTAEAFGATCEFGFERYYPPTLNHPQETEFARHVLQELVGAHNVLDFEGTLGAEDFSFYLLERPGCYFLVGNGDGDHRAQGHGPGTCMVHSSSYDFNDALIPLGGSMWVSLVEAWFAQAYA